MWRLFGCHVSHCKYQVKEQSCPRHHECLGRWQQQLDLFQTAADRLEDLEAEVLKPVVARAKTHISYSVQVKKDY